MNEEVFRQDLDENEAERPGGPFMIEFLFRESAAMPSKKRICAVIEKHVGKTECFCHDDKTVDFVAFDYRTEFQGQSVSVQLVVTVCTTFDDEEIDNFLRSQMWDCLEERDRILDNCRYRVITTDMLARMLPAAKHATLDMDFPGALSKFYPDCEAFYFPNSGKLFTAESMRRDETRGTSRFIYFGISVRLSNAQDNEDVVVNTLSMSTLFLPDLQYHLHGINPNWAVGHVYNVAAYLLGSGSATTDGETADGVIDGEMSSVLHWSHRYEVALIQSPGEILDINMGECASGTR